MNGDLSQIVNKIMSNPEFGNLVNELKNSDLAAGSSGGKEVSADDIMKKLPDVMGMLGMNASGKEAHNDTEDQATPVSAVPQSIDSEKIEKAVKALKKMDNQKCEKLLGALKPYLSRERGEVIDKAVSVMKITDILGAIQEVNPGDGKK